MIQIDVSNVINGLQNLADQLSNAKVNLAQARAINHTLAKAKVDTNQRVRAAYNIPAREVSKSLRVVKASSTKTSGELQISGSPIPIMSFQPYQTKQGISVTIRKGKRIRIRSAFIAKVKGSYKSVFARGGYEGGNGFNFRHRRVNKVGADLPIGKLFTVSIPSAFKSDEIIKPIENLLESNYSKRLEHELKFLISKK